MKQAAIGCVAIIAVVVFVPLSYVGLRVAGVVDGSVDVAQKEIGPKALLKKYEWFKNAAARLDQKRADIKQCENKQASLAKNYGDVPYKDWDRKDKETLSIWQSETAGIKMSYNALAAEYNSQMTKVNWRFANAGELPGGAAESLPREFAQYVEQ